MHEFICRFCSAKNCSSILDLKETALANSIISKDNLTQNEQTYRLHLRVCNNCDLIQVDDSVSADKIFSEYAYFSSSSSSRLKHSEDYVNFMIKKFNIEKKSLIIEVASNDGYLLQYFKNENYNVLGIEPAGNIAQYAIKSGIPTENIFLTKENAFKLKHRGVQADLMIANNVLAHVPDINDFVSAFPVILSEKGIITFEFQYVLSLLELAQFDTIYHEHFSYYSLSIVEKILKKHQLKIFDVQKIPTHGGSLRIFVTHFDNEDFCQSKEVTNLKETERKYFGNDFQWINNFQSKVNKISSEAINFINRSHSDGLNIVGYGVAAKANTFLNFCQIDKKKISYFVDKHPEKQNKYTPGTKIPIYSPEKLQETPPDIIIIFAWNLKNEILNELQKTLPKKTKYVTFIPNLEILN